MKADSWSDVQEIRSLGSRDPCPTEGALRRHLRSVLPSMGATTGMRVSSKLLSTRWGSLMVSFCWGIL